MEDFQVTDEFGHDMPSDWIGNLNLDIDLKELPTRNGARPHSSSLHSQQLYDDARSNSIRGVSKSTATSKSFGGSANSSTRRSQSYFSTGDRDRPNQPYDDIYRDSIKSSQQTRSDNNNNSNSKTAISAKTQALLDSLNAEKPRQPANTSSPRNPANSSKSSSFSSSCATSGASSSAAKDQKQRMAEIRTEEFYGQNSGRSHGRVGVASYV